MTASSRAARPGSTPTSGNVYVSDSGLDRVQKFTPDGAFVTKWGSTGTGNSQFQQSSRRPRGHMPATSTSPTSRTHGSEVRPQAERSFSAGEPRERGNGQFDGAYGVTTDAAGNVLRGRLRERSGPEVHRARDLLLKWGTLGTANGQLNSPDGLSACLRRGDRGGRAGPLPRPGLQRRTGASSTNSGPRAPTPASSRSLVDVETDSAGRFYTVEVNRSGADPGVQRARRLRDPVRGRRRDDGQFDGPRRVAADPFGNLLVADAGNDRVQRFRPVE